MGSKKVKSKFKASKRNKLTKNKNSNAKRLNFSLDINTCQLLKGFSEIRENYFKYLQSVVKENLKSARNENLQNDSLENISLEIEQPALMACMQSEIYQQIMLKIIQDIKSSTEQMKLHLGIKKVLLSKSLEDIEISPKVKKETDYYESNGFEEATNEEVYSHIPTISSVRANSSELKQGWSVQNVSQNKYGLFVNLPSQAGALPQKDSHGPLSVSYEAQNLMQAVYSPSAREQCVTLKNNNSPKDLSPMITTAQNQDSNNKANESKHNYISSNLVPVEAMLRTEENCNINLSETKTSNFETEIANDVKVNQSLKFNSGESASPLQSQIHLHDSYEGPLIKEEEREDEPERSQITQLINNTFEGETVLPDSLSYNHDETYSNNTNHENLLVGRLEEMRPMFGVQEYEEKSMDSVRNDWNVLESEKCDQSQKITKCNAWYHQKTMNLYRLSRMVSEMTPELWKEKRDMLCEYFGEDSDLENEADYVQEEKFLLSCKERISHWVVKYLMPYYQSGRIVGKSVFKILGHHISKSVIQRAAFPDEWTVKYVVSKYFTSDKIFQNESDVLSFQPEL